MYREWMSNLLLQVNSKKTSYVQKNKIQNRLTCTVVAQLAIAG
jgi:hypothetical protein